MTTWQLQEAKNKLSELINRALAEGPQVITRHGEEVVVVIPMAEYRELAAPKQRLVDVLMAPPFRGSELVIERDPRTELREVDL